jgi:hypothetical protein
MQMEAGPFVLQNRGSYCDQLRFHGLSPVATLVDQGHSSAASGDYPSSILVEAMGVVFADTGRISA